MDPHHEETTLNQPQDDDAPVLWVAEMEELISRIRDVRKVKVQTRGGEVSVIHVMADPGRAPKMIVRDIVSAVHVHLHREIDFQKISIVQMREVPDLDDVAPPPDVESPRRVRYDGLTIAVQGERLRVDVELRLAQTALRGTAGGRVRPGGAQRLVAEATLHAIAQCVEGDVEFELEDVQIARTSIGEALVVAVRVVNGRSQRDLVGTALDRGDSNQAAAVATLDAVNRVLAHLPVKETVEFVVD